MRKLLALSAMVCLLVAASCSGDGGSSGASSTPSVHAATGATSATGTTGGTLTKLEQAQAKIKHVLFIVQENRSFDHYFGSYRA